MADNSAVFFPLTELGLVCLPAEDSSPDVLEFVDEDSELVPAAGDVLLIAVVCESFSDEADAG